MSSLWIRPYTVQCHSFIPQIVSEAPACFVQWWMKKADACNKTCGRCTAAPIDVVADTSSYTTSSYTDIPPPTPPPDATPPPSDCYDKPFPDVRALRSGLMTFWLPPIFHACVCRCTCAQHVRLLRTTCYILMPNLRGMTNADDQRS